MINEERIKIKSNDIELASTIAYPDKEQKRPLVLLIAGTGSLDRDGNSKSLKLNIYKDLSDYFVSQGCVCIRYDKRGTHESKGKLATHTLSNLVSDAQNILEHCSTLDYVDGSKLIVCGHSEGAMVGTLLTEKTYVDGLILLGGAGISLKEAMFYQNDQMLEEAKNGKGFLYWLMRKTANPEQITKQVEGVFEKANKSNRSLFFYRGSIMPTKYMQEHGSLTGNDYVQKIKNYKGKVLAITGTEDLQANHKTLDQFKEMDNVDVFAPNGVNHILREVDDNNSLLTVMKQYKRLSKTPLHEQTLGRISEWLEDNFIATQSLER
jgi:pimeloyl-ACP methyl ester carboxylesterase